MSSTLEKPLVSVLILCYNTGKYVIEAIQSVLKTGYPSLDLVIIDDCSPDGVSADLVEQWLKDNQISCTFIRHTQNKGLCKSLNEALFLAKGEFVAGLGDDLWLPNRLDDEVKYLVEHPEVGLVFGNADIIDKESKLTGEKYEKDEYLLAIDREDRYLSQLENGNYIIPPACLYRTKVLKDLGGFDETMSFEDWDMYLRIAKSGFKIKYYNHSVVQYRRYGTSMWQSRSPKLLETCVDIYQKHGLLTKNASLLEYLNHFRDIPVGERSKATLSAWRKSRPRLAILLALMFAHAPQRLQYGFYNRYIRKTGKL